ncbi:hypothetical protein [Aeromonas enteropelogenes]|uniref:hypothetical protein n=1 Tax=Aeromonas enteropelogenes TaxID=29489 RepID=UPI0038D0F04D
MNYDKQQATPSVTLVVIGVVYGDIGTSAVGCNKRSSLHPTLISRFAISPTRRPLPIETPCVDHCFFPSSQVTNVTVRHLPAFLLRSYLKNKFI